MNRILIVEDDRQSREGLRTLVANAGFDVTVAADYARAAALLSTDRFDLLITDLDLPGGTGLDLVQHARAFSPRIATILVTAFGCSEVRKQAQDLALAGYFEKPLDPQALIELVKSSVGGRRITTARSR
ncbi:MAG TPA: response regulator [Vicinamibacteria bacterium]|jgi:two-component system response regulator PilR (NtrC family)